MQSSNPDPNLFIEASLLSEEVAAHIKELEAKNWRVRFDAAMALAQSKDSWAQEALYAATQHKRSNVRYDVAWALASLGDLRAVEPLGVAYKEWWRFQERNDIAKLLFQIAGEELPCQILASTTLTGVQKLKSLESLRDILYRPSVEEKSEFFYYSYEVDNVQAYCEGLCRQVDTQADVRQGAEVVLAELRNRQDATMLLRASERNEPGEAAELLRGTNGQAASTPPEELLRPSDTEAVRAHPENAGLFSRILHPRGRKPGRHDEK